jgi:hypothetical protein
MRSRVLPAAAGALTLCALLGCASGFAAVGSLALPRSALSAAAHGSARTRASGKRVALSAARMVEARTLDPMQLVQDKAMQTCALRAYRPKEENNGLSTATFALG